MGRAVSVKGTVLDFSRAVPLTEQTTRCSVCACRGTWDLSAPRTVTHIGTWATTRPVLAAAVPQNEARCARRSTPWRWHSTIAAVAYGAAPLY